MSIRATALSLLTAWEEKGSYINLSLGSVTESLTDSDRRFVTALVYGVVERLITLDYYINTLVRGAELSLRVRTLLRMGLYELTYMHTAPHAVVNETVKLARHAGEASLINGVLRRVIREPDALALPPREKNEARYLSIAYSIPLATVKHLRSYLGKECEAFLEAINSRAPLTLRVNTLKVSREELLAHFTEAGLTVEPTPIAPHGIRILSEVPVTQLFGFSDGYFFVQDEASQISTEVLAPKKGERILDICSCPGGKSFGAAIAMGNEGAIRSMDVHASKLSLITDGANRLGISIITPEEQDGRVTREDLVATADRIICDVPCSGIGVFGKKADLRYKEMDAIATLPALQGEILAVASQYVAPGGVLVYSTCTINPEENHGVVEAFLASHPNFTKESFAVGGLSSEDGELTLYPHRHKTDGFYIAKLRRSGQ